MMRAFVTYLFSLKDQETPTTMAVWKGNLESNTNIEICRAIIKQRPNQINIILLTIEVAETTSLSYVKNNGYNL